MSINFNRKKSQGQGPPAIVLFFLFFLIIGVVCVCVVAGDSYSRHTRERDAIDEFYYGERTMGR